MHIVRNRFECQRICCGEQGDEIKGCKSCEERRKN